jgi:hypothetical protein
MRFETVRVYAADQSDRVRVGSDAHVDPPPTDRIAEPDGQPSVA